jgi:hypothetical protein
MLESKIRLIKIGLIIGGIGLFVGYGMVAIEVINRMQKTTEEAGAASSTTPPLKEEVVPQAGGNIPRMTIPGGGRIEGMALDEARLALLIREEGKPDRVVVFNRLSQGITLEVQMEQVPAKP